MTRKRFVKLLMAKWPKWYDRNRANEIANFACNFAVAFEDVKRWNEEEHWN